METGKSQYLQYIVKHKSIPKLGVKDDNRELANGFGQFLTCNMHMNRYLELTTSLKQQMRTLLDTFVQLTEEAIFMVADRESAHFLRLYKTEFTNFLDEYERTVEPAMEADFIAPLTECKSKADRVLAKVEDDHTNALLEYRHYIAKLEKLADEDDTQKLLRTHEKLLNAASRLTTATNNVYEEFNLFDDYRRKLIFDQTPKMFVAQRQLFHELLETMDRMDLTAHPLPPPNHYRSFQVDVPPCPVPVADRETIGGGSDLAGDARPSVMARQNSKYARHMRTKSSPGTGVMPLSPIARNRPERAPWDSPEDDQKQPTTTSNNSSKTTSTLKKTFTLRRPQTASNTESKERPAPPTGPPAAPPTAPPPVSHHRRALPGIGFASAPTTPPRTRPPPPGPPRPPNPQAITPIRTPLASAPSRPSIPPPNPLQLPTLPARAPSPPQGPPPPSGRPPRPAPPPPAKHAPPPPPAKLVPHPPPSASAERGPPPPVPPRRRSYSEAPPAPEQQPASASTLAFARMPPPPPPVRRNSRANDLSQRDSLTAEVIDAVRAVQQNARRPSFDHS